MRPLLLLILTISVTTTWAETPQEKWEGYKPVSEAELPPKVKEFAENAVFYLESVDSAPGEEMKIIDLENDPIAKSITKDKKTLMGDIVSFQIETCRKQKLRYCPIASKRYSGTMFFNQGKFYTCRHNFHNWITVAAEANNLTVDKVTPPMILRIPNKEKPGKFKVVYQSSFQGDPLMKFSSINTSPNLNIKYDDQNPAYSGNKELVGKADFVEMAAPSGKSAVIKDYALPVENLTSDSKNIEVYSFGYPGETSVSALGERNAPGFQLSATNGQILGFYADRNLFYSSNFRSSGMSGGPVVTSDGKLAGLACAGFNNSLAASNPSLTNAGFFPLNKNQIQDFWKSTDLAQGTDTADSNTVVN